MSKRQPWGEISETPEEVLAAAMAGENSRMTMLTPGGHGPPKIHGKEISKEVANALFLQV